MTNALIIATHNERLDQASPYYYYYYYSDEMISKGTKKQKMPLNVLEITSKQTNCVVLYHTVGFK